ncbi:MAG: AsnC trans reg protein [Thermoproteota archaeon]|nr:AsnC trans reg protein [Thermoproteota archaeon]
MTKAFVLIKVKSGTEEAQFDALFTVPEVLEVHAITGDYDLMAVMSAKEEDLARYPNEKIVEALSQKIRKMENVLDTKTMIPISSEIKRSSEFDFGEYARGFVLLKVKPGRERHFITEVLKINEVIETHMITGSYDILAILEVKKPLLYPHYPEVIASIVTDKIRRIRDMRDSETIIPDLSRAKT